MQLTTLTLEMRNKLYGIRLREEGREGEPQAGNDDDDGGGGSGWDAKRRRRAARVDGPVCLGLGGGH
jgi:hypothetical protein